ncbi:MAG: hypothetical protein LIO58_04160 [Oscillospiraceae bacterium]|nr:hypothetical protein [Oscillospiraceae bacterium]
MSTLGEVIARVDAVIPNLISETDKCRWLSALDGQLAAETLTEAVPDSYAWPEDTDRELRLPHPWDGIYDLYLRAMLHESLGELTEYNAILEVFNSTLAGYLRYLRRRDTPAASGQFRTI